MPAPAPRTPAKIACTLLGLSVPTLLIAALWMWDWRWAATAAITGVTALIFLGATTPPKNETRLPDPFKDLT